MVSYSDNYNVEQESKWLHDQLRIIAQDAEDNGWSEEVRNNKMLKKIQFWQNGTRILRAFLSVLATIPLGLGWIGIASWEFKTKNNWFKAEVVSELKNELKGKEKQGDVVPLDDEEKKGKEEEKEVVKEVKRVVSKNEKDFEAQEANVKFERTYSVMKGNVFCVTFNGEKVAAKFLPKKERNSDEAIKGLKHSAWLFSHVDSPYVARFKAYVYDEEKGYGILMENVPGRTLKSFIENCKKDNIQLTIAQKVKLATELAYGFKAIHQSCMQRSGLVHGDVKDANVMVVRTTVVDKKGWGPKNMIGEKSHLEYSIKIVDPDSMHAVDEPSAEASTFWTAPEMAKSVVAGEKAEKSWFGNVKNSTSQGTDVYGFGLLLWEILMLETLGFRAFKDKKGEKLPAYVKQGKNGRALQGKLRMLYLMGADEHKDLRPIRPVVPKDANQKLAILVRWCWNEDPGARPSMDQAIQMLKGMK